MELINQSAGCFEFAANGSSSAVDALGMRQMQALAYQQRNEQYLLIKAPPACGKSRALMFIALDKLKHQGIQKVIVAVPQKAIGSSFKDTKLENFGQDWTVNPFYDLCRDDLSDTSKVNRIKTFFDDPNNSILVCAHPTLINFYKNVQDKSKLNQTLVAIDEFHHVSVDESNQLGGIVQSLMENTSAHIVAMTGSYFRGDRLSVLSAEDEAKFKQVIYTYYQQLNGYQYLKHLKLDYSFYDSTWLEGLDMLLNPSHARNDYSMITAQDYYDPESLCFDRECGKPHIEMKTIIYIPNVNSSASTSDKENEFKSVCEILGHDGSKPMEIDSQTGFYNITTRQGKRIKVANLVYEETQKQTINALRQVKSRDDVDFIIALGMAKEGFDWPWCEHVLVAGFRKSLTEVVQIIGRATRDCPGKSTAKFTNLVKVPDVVQGDAQAAVDDLLKAISLSLMMEQVLQPNIKFVPRSEMPDVLDPDKNPGGRSHGGKKQPIEDVKVISINDEELTPKVRSYIKEPNAILDQAHYVINNLSQLKQHIFTPPEQIDYANDIFTVDVAEILSQKLPKSKWAYDDVHSLAKLVHLQMIYMQQARLAAQQNQDNADDDQQDHNTSFVQDKVQVSTAGADLLNLRKHFINVSELNFTLIAQCNPFGGAYEFVSRILDAEVLKEVQRQAKLTQHKMTEEEALMLWDGIKHFVETHKRNPRLDSQSMYESRLAAALQMLRKIKKQQRQA